MGQCFRALFLVAVFWFGVFGVLGAWVNDRISPIFILQNPAAAPN